MLVLIVILLHSGGAEDKLILPLDSDKLILLDSDLLVLVMGKFIQQNHVDVVVVLNKFIEEMSGMGTGWMFRVRFFNQGGTSSSNS